METRVVVNQIQSLSAETVSPVLAASARTAPARRKRIAKSMVSSGIGVAFWDAIGDCFLVPAVRPSLRLAWLPHQLPRSHGRRHVSPAKSALVQHLPLNQRTLDWRQRLMLTLHVRCFARRTASSTEHRTRSNYFLLLEPGLISSANWCNCVSFWYRWCTRTRRHHQTSVRKIVGVCIYNR